jgi:hypothetical protein
LSAVTASVDGASSLVHLLLVVAFLFAQSHPLPPMRIDTDVPAERSMTRFISIALVVLGWLLFLWVWYTPISGNSDVAGFGILLWSLVGCGLAATGGALAFMTLRQTPTDTAARIGLWLAILSVAAAILGAVNLFAPL